MPQTNRDVWVLPADGKPMPFLATTHDERSAMLSPDGRWMLYAVLEAGREEEVYVQRYPGLAVASRYRSAVAASLSGPLRVTRSSTGRSMESG